MNLEGERTFDAPRATVWKVLNDPSSMAKTMPGVESFDIHDDKRWTANVKIPLGLGGLKMKVDMEKTEVEDRSRPRAPAPRFKIRGSTACSSASNCPLTRSAVWSTSAWESVWSRIPAAMLVTQEIASTLIPMCRAAITSPTVDIPTRSAPIVRKYRISAGVS